MRAALTSAALLLVGIASLAFTGDPTATNAFDPQGAIADKNGNQGGNQVIEPASAGHETIARPIIISALPPKDTEFICIEPPPPGINNADVWVDSDGDGLPGPDIIVPAQTSFAVDVWIDTHSYAWTNFFIGLALVPPSADMHDYLTAFSVTYHVIGGEGFPLDDFTVPWGVGMGGFLFPEHSGTQRLLTFSAQSRNLATPQGSPFCVTPVVDLAAPEKFFSSVGTQTSFSLFCAGTVDSVCYTILPSTAEEGTTWGRVKGLFH